MLTEEEKKHVHGFIVKVPKQDTVQVNPDDPDYENAMTLEELEEYLNGGGD